MQPGTAAHRDLFCRAFIDTHVAFEPEDLPWPELDPFHRERLRAFPLWSYARGIEQRAGRMVTAFAQTLEDPLIREAVALQGLEETRHGRLMAHVMERYGIDTPHLTIPDPPARREDWLVFGFGECTDSFVGFGAFAMARERRLFPESLLSLFEGVLWEEARHITFFINWWRYEEARAGRDGFVRRAKESLRYHLKAIKGTAEGGADVPQLPDMSAAEIKAMLDGVSPLHFLEVALAENKRHMDKMDRRLLKPRLMPGIATALVLALRMLPPRAPSQQPALSAAV